MSDDPRSFPETAQQLAALVDHAVTMHETHGWAGPEHSTVDCAMWAVGQFRAVHGDTLTVETVSAAMACTSSMRALVAAEAADGETEAADDAGAAAEHAEHADEVFELVRAFLEETTDADPG